VVIARMDEGAGAQTNYASPHGAAMLSQKRTFVRRLGGLLRLAVLTGLSSP
jgi:hypothetical protein